MLPAIRVCFIPLALLTLALGCAVPRGYPGAERGRDEVALLKGGIYRCFPSIRFTNVDGRFAGTELEVLPGNHTIELTAVSEPYQSNQAGDNPLDICFDRGTFEVDLKTTAGNQYMFNPQFTKVPSLTITEAPRGRADAGVVLDVTPRLKSRDRRCGLFMHYRECLPHYR